MVTARVPKKYVLASAGASLGGLLNGLDSGCVGAIINMPQFASSVGVLSSSMIGFTVSLVMLGAAFPSVFSGYLADRFGRLRIVLAGAVVYALGLLLQGSAHALPQFLLGRTVAGLGQGIYLGNVSVYICEIAPARYRGVLSGLPQFQATAGICIGYFMCYGSIEVPSSMAWRSAFVLQGSFAVLFAGVCLVLPESPRWLMQRGRRREALEALRNLDFDMAEAESFLVSTDVQQPSLSVWQSFALLFRRGYRARTILALFILGMVQLSGIDGVVYYAPILFSKAGLSSSTASFLASGVSAILMLAISVPAFLLADSWGRRTSAITGGIGLTGCMLLVGSLYAAGVVHADGAARWVVIVAFFVFGMTYCATLGIVGKIYASEIQPSNTRAAANCVAMGLSFFTNWFVAMITPILLDKSAFAAYFLFGGLSLGTTLVLAAYMPETRGRSLENIQEAFRRPALKSVSHYIKPLLSRHRRRHVPVASPQDVTTPQDGSMEMETQSATASALSIDNMARTLRVDYGLRQT